MPIDTLLDALDRHADARPEACAFRFLATGDEETDALTFGALRDRARALGARLAALAAPGDRALLVYPPGLPFIVGFLGCLHAGLVAVPLQAPRRAQSMDKLRAVLDDCGAQLVLTDTELAATLQARLAEVGREDRAAVVDTSALLAGVADDDDAGAARPPVRPDALAFLQYTSGSTGQPKGVCVTHAQIAANSRMIEELFGHHPGTVMCGWLPMFHDMGLVGSVMQPVWTGFSCVLMPPAAFVQKPLRWMRAVSRYRVTSSGGPNFGFDACVQRHRAEDLAGVDLSSWTVAFNGAEPVRAATMRAFAERFAPHGFRAEALFPCYGMAEATLLVSGGPERGGARVLEVDAAACDAGRIEPAAVATPEGRRPESRALVSCGVLPRAGGAAVRIVDPDRGVALPENRIGEICLAGPHLLAGYWGGDGPAPLGDKQWTDPADGRAWFRSGDLGFLREGELHVCGRLKDLVIVAGRNLFPQDLEALVEASHEAFERNASAAFTIDVGTQERLVMLQEIRRDHRHRFDEAEGRAQARAALAQEFEVALHDIVFVPALTLPKTSSGKIMRRACRQWYLDAKRGIDAPRAPPQHPAVAPVAPASSQNR
jgi:acyl-CoA synthetase (AMP-forming)/AMP-acid ligase II